MHRPSMISKTPWRICEPSFAHPSSSYAYEAASVEDTVKSAGTLARPNLINALASNSAPSLEWLTSKFGIDLSLVARLGGHNIPRTHRGKGGAPGWAITSALIKQLDKEPNATVIKSAKVLRLLEESGKVTGVEYESGGKTVKEEGPVVIATGYVLHLTDLVHSFMALVADTLLTSPPPDTSPRTALTFLRSLRPMETTQRVMDSVWPLLLHLLRLSATWIRFKFILPASWTPPTPMRKPSSSPPKLSAALVGSSSTTRATDLSTRSRGGIM